MKKQILLIISLIIGYYFSIYLIIVSRNLLSQNFYNNSWESARITFFSISIFILITIITLALSFIKRIGGLKCFLNLNFYFKINNVYLFILPITIFIIPVFNEFGKFSWVYPEISFLYFGAHLAVGFSEELIFRGILLYLFLEMFKASRFQVIIALLLSSVIFGYGHMINYFKIGHIENVISQSNFALAYGCFSAGLFLKTRNLYAVSILHVFYNIGVSDFEEVINMDYIELMVNQTKSLTSKVFGTALFFTLIITGVY